MVKCKICGTDTNNKVYCSKDCHNQGMTAKKRICPECGKQHKNKIFCSRACYAIEDSRRKKEYFKNNDHHNKGLKHTEQWKKETSDRMKKLWENENHSEKVKKSKKETLKNRKYPFGWHPEARLKRDKTMKERYGGHNWSGEYGTRECDKSFIKKYGMKSYEYMNLKLRETIITSIEQKMMDFLKSENIDYEYEYLIEGHYFDFYLPKFKIVIECDGDYFHSYNVSYEDMDEIQRKTYYNDIKKNKIIESKTEFKLFRFWEHEIYNGIHEKMLKKIWQK